MTDSDFELIIGEKEQGRRLDHVLSEAKLATRSQLKKWIENGCCLVNGEHARPAQKLQLGDRVEIKTPEPVALDHVEAEDIPLCILYEDDDLIIIDKAAGMVVHPAPGHFHGTLVSALLFHCKNLSGIGGVLRPGIVHRLDRFTTGVMVAAKSEKAHGGLAKQFAEHSIERAYQAFVCGQLDREGCFDTFHGRHPTDRKRYTSKINKGRRAVTHYRRLDIFEGACHVEARLETGRTHQVRVHFSDHGFPLIGDPIYGRVHDPRIREIGKTLKRQALHASNLSFTHPISQKRLSFHSELPEDMNIALNALKKEKI